MNPETILKRLLMLPHETEWVEWKENDCEPQELGEYLSALSNSAALHRKDAGYIVWGIKDGTREIVGTRFKPRQAKIGNQELENWLTTQLTPPTNFRIYDFEVNQKSMVLVEVLPASNAPIAFKGTEFIRVGSYKKKLKNHPEKERELWALFSRSTFEGGIVSSRIASDEVLSALDYATYFDLTKQSLPETRSAILDRLVSDKLIKRHVDETFDVTNLGGILSPKI